MLVKSRETPHQTLKPRFVFILNVYASALVASIHLISMLGFSPVPLFTPPKVSLKNTRAKPYRQQWHLRLIMTKVQYSRSVMAATGGEDAAILSSETCDVE